MRKYAQAATLTALIPLCVGANLTYSTYLRDGFTPTAMASDTLGNLYLAGTAVIDPLSRTTSAVVAKLDPSASRYIYLQYLDSAGLDSISAIAVDTSGNLFVTGTTANPNFPVTDGHALGTLPTSSSDTRAYVTKLSSTGMVLFSALIGGSAMSSGRGIAVAPQGQILVSGISGGGFASTPGAFSVPDTANKWFLTELDASGAKIIFSSTGIGGSSIALDSTGNIFLAGSSFDKNYPTTSGAFQTTFTQGFYCFGLCQIGLPGQLQHLTKVDPTGSNLLYSTGINDPNGGAGSTVNTGLAVDSAGNAYVTGTLLEGRYPFTAGNSIGGSGSFLSKIDPTGSSLLFSVPVGGGGVLTDASGSVYTAGTISTYNPVGFPGLTPPVEFSPPDGLSWLPKPCVPNGLTTLQGAYLLKLDPSTGKALNAQWVDGSSVTAAAVTLIGTKLWASGPSLAADVPITPGALTSTNLTPGPLPGAFLSAADFSAPPAPQANGAPVIACVLDAGNLSHAGPVAAYQVLSIFGANLGPTTGVPAPDGTDPSIAGVTVTFDGNPAKMTYVSPSQINVLVPSPASSRDLATYPSSTLMQISVGGVSVQRQLPLTVYNLNLFADIGSVVLGCPPTGLGTLGYLPVALNADGARNSCLNPAKYGSLISVFVHGAGAQQLGLPMPDTVSGIEAKIGACVAAVENVALTGIVYKVDVRLPTTMLPCTEVVASNAINPVELTLTHNGMPAGPLITNGNPSPSLPARSQPMPVWVTNP